MTDNKDAMYAAFKAKDARFDGRFFVGVLLARTFVHGVIDFDLPAQPEEEMKKLMAIRGIGSWTAHRFACHGMAGRFP